MKKIFVKILTTLFCLFILCPSKVYSEESMDVNLDINSNVIVNTIDSGYKTELDIYNIELFTENEKERAEKEKEEQELETQRLCDSLFNEGLETEEEDLSKEIEKYNLFSSKVIPDKISYSDTNENNYLKYIIIILVACILTGILTRLYYIKKYKGEKDDFEYYNYFKL